MRVSTVGLTLSAWSLGSDNLAFEIWRRHVWPSQTESILSATLCARYRGGGWGWVTMSRTLRADENKGDGLARTCATGGMLSSLSSSFAW